MRTRGRVTRSPPGPRGPGAIDRRRFVGVGVGALIGLVGCVGPAPAPPARDASTDSTGPFPSSTTLAPSRPTAKPSTSTTRGPDPTGSTIADDESSGSPPAMVSELRLMHVGVDAPGVDLRVVQAESPTIADIPFGQSSGYVTLPSGDYAFELALTELGPSGPTLELPIVTLAAARAYTIAVIGTLVEDPTLQTLVLEDDASELGPDTIRATFVHAAPTLGELDVLEVSGGKTRILRENSSFSDAGRLPNLPLDLVEIGIDVDDDGQADLTFKLDAETLAGVPTHLYLTHDVDQAIMLLVQWPDDTVAALAAD